MPRRRHSDDLTLDLFAWRSSRLAALVPWQKPPFHFLSEEQVEVRPYIDPAWRAWETNENFGIVADTSSGKTYIAYVLADQVFASGKRVLFCAPNVPLCEQHAALARTLFSFEASSVGLLAGRLTPKRRAAVWRDARLLIATPQTAANDLESGSASLDDFGLVIIDEAHHAARTYAAIRVASVAKRAGARILALTASPGGDAERIERVRTNLELQRWVRISDADTGPFRPPARELQKIVPLSQDVQPVVLALERTIRTLTSELADAHFIETATAAPSLKQLTGCFQRIRAQQHARRTQLLTATAASMKLVVVLMKLVSEDYDVALGSLRAVYGERNAQRDLSLPARRIRAFHDVLDAGVRLRQIVDGGTVHPKRAALLDAVETALRDAGATPRVLIYDQYAECVHRIVAMLRERTRLRVEPVLGRSHMRSAHVIDVLRAFEIGEVAIIVGTSVIREGVHIPAIDVLIEYSPHLEERSLIQLRGRVGRTAPGTIVSIIADHELERRFVFSSQSRARRMRSLLPHEDAQVAARVGATRKSFFSGHPRKPRTAFIDQLNGTFVFERFRVLEIVIERRESHPYLRCLVGDRTGTIALYLWCPRGSTDVATFTNTIHVGSVVIVAGTYHNEPTPRIIVNPRDRQHVIPCPAGDYDLGDYDRGVPF